MDLDLCSVDAFGVDIDYLDGGVHVALRGELDLATAPALHEYLSEFVTQGWIFITLDLAELRYIDSTGLSLLVMTQQRVKRMGGSLLVRHPTPTTLKLFATTGLTEILLGADASVHALRPRQMAATAADTSPVTRGARQVTGLTEILMGAGCSSETQPATDLTGT